MLPPTLALALPWAPLCLRTRGAGSVRLILGFGHTHDDCWIECDLEYVSTGRRRQRLHPVQIVAAAAGPRAQHELSQLQRAVSAYRASHGYWIGTRWRSHHRPSGATRVRQHKARRKKYRNRQHSARRHEQRQPAL